VFSERDIVKPGLDFELLNRIGIRNWNPAACDAAGLQIGDGHAIEFVTVVVGTRTVDEDSVIARIDFAKPLPPRPDSHRRCLPQLEPWRKVDNLREISCRQRQCLDHGSINDSSQRDCIALQWNGIAMDFDTLDNTRKGMWSPVVDTVTFDSCAWSISGPIVMRIGTWTSFGRHGLVFDKL
jgi:hypothetical protein